MSRQRRNFSAKFRSDLVIELLKGEKDLNTLAAENNIQPNLLRNWKRATISKKAWLADRFEEGLVFLKSVERGKCFIEYIPAEYAWNPIEAPGYMYIDCLWVSGSFKGHGYSSDLLSECIGDSKAKGKKGLCILAAAKKEPFLADPKFLKYKGFEVCDEADNGIWFWKKLPRRMAYRSKP